MNDPGDRLRGYCCTTCTRIRIDPGEDCDHDELERVTGTHPGVAKPGLQTVLEAVFMMSSTELEVCLCVMDAGEATIEEIAARIDASRTTVSRHVDHLDDIGVLEPDERVRPSGGRVTRYTTASPETVRARFKFGLCHWMAEAVQQIDSLTEEKVREIGDIWLQREDEADERAIGDRIYSRESTNGG